MIVHYRIESNMSFKEKSQIALMILAILLYGVVSFSILNVHGEDFPDYFVAGFVYINGEKTDGIEVIVSVPGYENRSNISHYDADYDLHGLYKIGFYADQGQYYLAEENFLKAIEVEPNYTKAYYNLGIVYLRQEKRDLAKKNFQKVLKLEPNNQQAKTNIDLLNQ